MSVAIECQARPEKVNPRALRRQGLIPGNLYGHQGRESICFVLKAKDVELLMKQAAVDKTVVNVNIPEVWNGKAMIKEIQTHPWKNNVYHVSFSSVK